MRIFAVLIWMVLAAGCNTPEANEKLMQKSIQAIDNMQGYQYQAWFEVHQEGAATVDSMKVYFEGNPSGSPFPFRYVLESSNGDLQVFDEEVLHTVMNADRTIVRMENPPSYVLSSNQGLLYSPYYIRILLDHLLNKNPDQISYAGRSVKAGATADVFDISMDHLLLPDGSVVRNGDLLPNQMHAEGLSKRYAISIDSQTHLPVSFREIFPNEDYLEVTFTGLQATDPDFRHRARTIHNQAYLVIGMEEFMKVQAARQNEILNQSAKSFQLTSILDEEIRLSDYSGKPVLLEFWFPGCGFCQNAVPKVNAIAKAYQPRGLQVFGVEFSDASPDRIERYMQEYQVEIPVLVNGKNLALEYGINSGPTFVLLDASHTVVYVSNGLDEEALTNELDNMLLLSR